MKNLRERFVNFADRVSYGMGLPSNIMFWFVLLVVWTGLGPTIAHTHWLPEWFTSSAWNFPLNTITTIIEMFVGFLIAASNNRQERHLFTVLERIEQLEQKILDDEEGHSD